MKAESVIMKVLIVDDSPEKAALIETAVRAKCEAFVQCTVSIVRTLNGAVRNLNIVRFDLVVLDLMLPFIDGGAADSRAGFELLRQVRANERINRTTSVLALSAFPDEVSSFREKFDQLGVLITPFDDTGAWHKALSNVLDGVGAKAERSIDVDFIIVCALEKERAGFERCVELESEAVVAGLNVHYVSLPGAKKAFGAILRLSRMGLVAATFETSLALNVFRTQIVCMSGICAGFRSETALGQVIVASPAWEYQAGKWSKDGFEIAPLQVGLRPATRAIIDQIIANKEFFDSLEHGLGANVERPNVRKPPVMAPFVTGSAVIADPRRLAHIVQQHRKVAALDMETYGVYYAANESDRNPRHFFAAKAVVDFADEAKGDALHSYGCIVSAQTTVRIVLRLVQELEESQ
jgi:nucleoside phosphorylase